MRLLLVLGIVLAACLAGLPSQPLPAAGDKLKPPPEPVEELIRRLGSPQFKERDEATRLLLERKDALPALRKIVDAGSDLELARRAAFILEEAPRRQARRMLDRLRALAKAGAVDQCAELLARWPAGQEEAACWEVTRRLALTLSKFHRPQGRLPDDKFLLKGDDAPKVISATRVTNLPRGSSFLFLRGGEVSPARFDMGVVVSSGSVRVKSFGSGVIFAADSVEVGGGTKGPRLIVSDGDVTLQGGAYDSTIIARGSVTAGWALKDCLVVSGKTVTSPSIKPQYAYENCTIKQNEPFPLDFVRFFDPAREGVVVEPAEGKVRVKAAEAAKPFAQAGLRTGDLITTVDGEAVPSPEAFRRLLRRAWVGDEGVALRVVRDGKTLQILVPTPR